MSQKINIIINYMSRILYLIFILFLTIVFSSVIKYEYFSAVFDVKFKESNNTDGNVQIINETGKDIWIIFTKSVPWDSIKDGWDFYTNDITISGITTGNDESYLYFGPIQTNDIFSCKYKSDSSPIWKSGKCSILTSKPETDINLEGLTALEWTFNPSGTFSPDISALEGINIQVTMEVKEGVECDENNKRECKIDFDNTTVKKYINNTNNIKSVRRPPWDESVDKDFSGTDGPNGAASKCGTFADNQNCITCPFKNDPCGPDAKLTDSCNLDAIEAKWGCYKWWANPLNSKAKDWLDVYKTGEGCNDSYRWVFDETGIYLPDDAGALNTLDKPFMDEGEVWNDSSKKYLCSISKEDTYIKENCVGYPVNKINGPNVNCQSANKETKVIFTIHKILS
jgi:hypothetical protein